MKNLHIIAFIALIGTLYVIASPTGYKNIKNTLTGGHYNSEAWHKLKDQQSQELKEFYKNWRDTKHNLTEEQKALWAHFKEEKKKLSAQNKEKWQNAKSAHKSAEFDLKARHKMERKNLKNELKAKRSKHFAD